MANSDVCMNCGKSLPSLGSQPCPYCGGRGRKIIVEIHETVGVKDDLAIGITHGPTGRYALHSDSVHQTDTLLIGELVRKAVDGQPEEFDQYLESLISPFRSATTTEETFYRGVDARIRDRLIENQIGPAPTPVPGRYNLDGEKCIYLIDSGSFLKLEVAAADMLIQEYRIPLYRMKVADLTPQNAAIANSLSLVFQMTERGKTGAGYDFEKHLIVRGSSRYFVSQLVAGVFKRHGWQGLYVPGVHGEKGITYRNLVLFGDCVDRWREWAVGNFRSP